MSDAHALPPAKAAKKPSTKPRVPKATAKPLTGPDGSELPPVPPPPSPVPGAGPVMEPTRHQPGVQPIGPVDRTPRVRDPETGEHLVPVPPQMSTMVGGIGVKPTSRLAPLLPGLTQAGEAGKAQGRVASLVLALERWESISRALVKEARDLLEAASGEHQRFYAAAAVLAQIDPNQIAELTGDVETLLTEHAAVLAGEV